MSPESNNLFGTIKSEHKDPNQPINQYSKNTNMLKSIPIVNINKSMHPLLLPTLNHFQYEEGISSARENTLTPSNLGIPQSDFLSRMTPTSSSSPNMPININKSYSILGVGNSLNSQNDGNSNSIQHSPLLGGKTINYLNDTECHSHGNNNIDIPKQRKRQRLGPSCDTCRSRKVRCDAKIEVLYEDDRLINEISDKLNYVLKPSEARELSQTLLRYHNLPEEIFEENDEKISLTGKKKMMLMKHINKLVLFQPCTSCVRMKNHKRKNSYAKKWKVDSCKFSKGLTKSDTNIFNEINRLTGKTLEEMTCQDFNDADFADVNN